jgi:ubiquinone/menaquinone biosynthesis C-methylase UbiE
MMLGLVHRAVSKGWVYDISQTLAGAGFVRHRVRSHLETICQPGSRTLDVGGGTGTMQAAVSPGCAYFCLDVEMPKLIRYARMNNASNPLLGDAGQMPVRTSSIDVVLCLAMSHHLHDDVLSTVLDESRRVLKRDGRILFLDAIHNPNRWRSRVLWSVDRGSYPRAEEKLLHPIQSRFNIEHWERFAVHHEYVLGVGRRT